MTVKCLTCGAENNSNLNCPTCQENWLKQYSNPWGNKVISKLSRIVYFIIGSIFAYSQPSYWMYATGICLIFFMLNLMMELGDKKPEES